MTVAASPSFRTLATMMVLAFTLPNYAHADDHQPCDDATVAAVAEWAGIKGALISRDQPGGSIAATACKAMPNSPNVTISAIAFDTTPERSRSRDGDDVQQIIALVKDDKVIAANRSVVQEDAMTLFGNYRIDTAPYQLSPAVRAFAVVFESDAPGPHCADAAESNELTLWVQEAHHLRPVFGTNLDGWVRADNTTCDNGDGSETAHMTIAVEKTSNHGFADLTIAAHVTESKTTHGNDVEIKKGTIHKTLKYDGKSYGVDMFRDFWYPSTSPMSSAKAAR